MPAQSPETGQIFRNRGDWLAQGAIRDHDSGISKESAVHRAAFKVVALGLVLAAGMGGCSSSKPVARRQTGIIVGTQGAGSEMVFSGVQVAAVSDPRLVGPEYARRDADLAIREPATAFDFDSWPAAPQPTLDGMRRIFISDSPTQFMYFNSNSSYQYRSYQGTCPYWP